MGYAHKLGASFRLKYTVNICKHTKPATSPSLSRTTLPQHQLNSTALFPLRSFISTKKPGEGGVEAFLKLKTALTTDINSFACPTHNNMEIFEMELEKPLEGSPANQQQNDFLQKESQGTELRQTSCNEEGSPGQNKEDQQQQQHYPQSGRATKYRQVKMKYLRSLNFREDDMKDISDRRAVRNRSFSLPVANVAPHDLTNAVPIPRRGGTQDEAPNAPPQTISDLSMSMSASLTSEPLTVALNTAIFLSFFSFHKYLTPSPDMCICVYVYMCICVYVYMCICVYVQFVPPHELVRRDTFSVWHYEQKKLAANRAL